MASLSYLNQLLRTNTLPVTPLNSTPSISPPTIPVRSKHFKRPIVSANVSRRMVYVQADSNDGEWEPEKEEPEPFVAVAVAEVEPEPVESEKEILKKALVGLFYGTERGLKASSETGAEILELVTQLEAKNPTPASTEAFSVLNGKWILAYTSYAGLYPLLSSGIFPLLKVEELSQIIDSESLTVQNSVKFVGPLTTTSISTTAKFEIRSPNRLKIKFEEGIIGIPELTDALEIPENVELFGQIINLTHFKEILTSVQNTAASVPSLKFPILNSYNSQSWLLTTYLDEELRIAKSDGGSVYVLIKEGSSLLKY